MESGTKQPRIGVIGAGGIGKTHLRTWQALGLAPVAIADAVPDVLARAVAEYGGEPWDDGLALITSGTVDLVSICTPPAFHADLAIAALEAGVAVLCEKPLATSVAGAERVVAAAERTGTMIAVGFCHRFQPQVETLRDLIRHGDLGVVREFRNRFAGHLSNAEQRWFSRAEIAGGGVLVDTSVHSVDLFRFLIGDPVQVQAVTSTVASPLGPALEVEDTGIIILKTADGALGVIESSWRTPVGEWTLSVHGTAASATLDYGTGELSLLREGSEPELVPVEPGDRFEREMRDVVRCWATGAEPRATLHDGLAATRILAEAYAAAAT
jgi:predicted dehydrogenase